jgi:hypothetical protein
MSVKPRGLTLKEIVAIFDVEVEAMRRRSWRYLRARAEAELDLQEFAAYVQAVGHWKERDADA